MMNKSVVKHKSRSTESGAVEVKLLVLLLASLRTALICYFDLIAWKY